VEEKIGADTKIMVLPSKYGAGIEFSDALLYKLLALMACVLAVPSNGSQATPHTGYIKVSPKVRNSHYR